MHFQRRPRITQPVWPVESHNLSLSTLTSPYGIMDQSTIDDTLRQERIDALLHQENSYFCPDYLSPDYVRKEQIPVKPSPLRIIEECARLITDLSLEPPQSFHRVGSPSSITSTAFVASATDSKFPVDMEHTHLATATWRRQMCVWAYKAVDTFNLDRELVAVAFDILDRYLSREIKLDCDITREDFQLFSMTCVYMAIKVLEPTRKLSIPALIDMSRGYYCAKDISETEMEILEVLQWRINGPTPLSFVQELAALLPVAAWSSGGAILQTCRELTELAVMDEFFVSDKASTIAVAVMLTAARQHGQCTKDVETLVNQRMRVDMDDVTRLCKHMER